ncbi:50S ribosomal protein L4 [Eubacteriales bacterium OttesenSCG-928-N13]|nr:50S ribosomal protein L4 [Eubacteriales bacterium OttesenSCG-928-N13]
MPKVAMVNMQGKKVGDIELSDNTFGAEIHESALHTVVRAQLNAKRQGTQSAKTRTEVRGGGRKIYRQKGTGNARHHSRRAPQFTHGGVVFAPKPRDYRISVPRKVRRLAMKSALTTKVIDGDLIVLDKMVLSEAKTKLVVQMLKDLGATRKALLVLPQNDETVLRASGNIQGLKVAFVSRESATLNVLDILGHDKFIVTEEAARMCEEVYD